MLAYLETADYSIREEMVLKVIYIQCMIRTFTDSRKSTFLIFRWLFWLRSTPPTTSGTDMLKNHLLILIPIKLIVSNSKPIPKFQSLWQCNLLNCRYVDVILNLIRLAGDYVSEEVGSNPKNLSFGFKIAFLDFELSLYSQPWSLRSGTESSRLWSTGTTCRWKRFTMKWHFAQIWSKSP